jgi:hypothetical protein
MGERNPLNWPKRETWAHRRSRGARPENSKERATLRLRLPHYRAASIVHAEERGQKESTL